METNEFGSNPTDPAQILAGLATANEVLFAYEQASGSSRDTALLKERYGLSADQPDDLLRNEVIATTSSPLADAGLELYAPTDIGYDNHGRKKQIPADQPRPFAVAITDAAKFGILIKHLETLPDNYQRQMQSAPIQVAIVGTNRAIKSEFASNNPLDVVHAERLLANMEQLIRSFDRIYDYDASVAYQTTKRYIAHWHNGTLADYLGAEELELVCEEPYAYGPATWGGNATNKPLYAPEERGEKWRKALDYLKHLRTKESPYFSDLFTELRDAFSTSAALIYDRAQNGEGASREDAIMDAVEAMWTADFEYEDALYRMEKATKATILAQYVLAYGLEKKDVPELLSDADETSVVAARGLLRQTVQGIFNAAAKCMVSAAPLSPVHIAQRHDAERNDHLLTRVTGTNNIRYRKTDRQGTLSIQTDIIASNDALEQIEIRKYVTHYGKDADKDDAEVEVYVDEEGIDARLLGARYQGAELLDEPLGQAESIQVAEALLRQVEIEISHHQ